MTENSSLPTSKTDQFACSLHTFADSVAVLDDMFANAEGHIVINSVDDYLKLGSLGLTTLKNVYACYGKEVKINVPGVGGKILNLILELLVSLQTTEDVKTKTTSNVTDNTADVSVVTN